MHFEVNLGFAKEPWFIAYGKPEGKHKSDSFLIFNLCITVHAWKFTSEQISVEYQDWATRPVGLRPLHGCRALGHGSWGLSLFLLKPKFK